LCASGVNQELGRFGTSSFVRHKAHASLSGEKQLLLMGVRVFGDGLVVQSARFGRSTLGYCGSFAEGTLTLSRIAAEALIDAA